MGSVSDQNLFGWIVLKTEGRHTLPLARSLAGDGFDVWTPIETLSLPGTRRKGQRAMFSRYVFARGDQDRDMLRLSHTPGRHAPFKVLMLVDRIARVPDSEIAKIRDAVEEAHAMAQPRKAISPFSRGSSVRIKKGVYKGVTGEVERADGREAKVWITMFGRHQKLTLPLYTLEDLNPPEDGPGEEMKIAA